MVALLRTISGYEHAVEIPIRDIETTTFLNFRSRSEETTEFEELVQSIARFGLLHPLIVRPSRSSSVEHGDYQYQLVSGYRRFAACRKLGLTNASAHIMELTDQRAMEIALVENLQRENFNPIEEAEAFKSYVTNFGRGSISRLARKIGKSEEYVSHRLLLLGLPRAILDRISRRLLNSSQAMELVWLRNQNQQVHLSNAIGEKNLSVKEVRSISSLVRKTNSSLNDAIQKVVEMRGKNTQISPEFQLKSEDLCIEPWRNFDDVVSQGNEYQQLNVLDRAVLVVRVCLSGFDLLLNKTENDPKLAEILMSQRNQVHSILDELIRTSTRSKRSSSN